MHSINDRPRAGWIRRVVPCAHTASSHQGVLGSVGEPGLTSRDELLNWRWTWSSCRIRAATLIRARRSTTTENLGMRLVSVTGDTSRILAIPRRIGLRHDDNPPARLKIPQSRSQPNPGRALAVELPSSADARFGANHHDEQLDTDRPTRGRCWTLRATQIVIYEARPVGARPTHA
jgi:hypothetical protein